MKINKMPVTHLVQKIILKILFGLVSSFLHSSLVYDLTEYIKLTTNSNTITLIFLYILYSNQVQYFNKEMGREFIELE